MMVVLMENASCMIEERDHDVEQSTCMGLEKREEAPAVARAKRFPEEESNYIRHAGQHGRWSCNNQISEGCKLALKDSSRLLPSRSGFS